MNKRIWLIIGIALLFCIALITIFYNDLAINFSKDNYKGEFFKVILTFLGGIGVIYGFYLNSERIKQGNKQLLQQEKNNTNTRFKDAVTLLGNDNPAIVLGGIHTLNQIAIDNIEYKQVVADILCNYVINVSDMYRVDYPNLNNKYTKSDCISIIQLIVDLIFAGSYDNIRLDFSNARFYNIKFKNEALTTTLIDNCDFVNCRFDIIRFNNINYQNVLFVNCVGDKIFIDNSHFHSSKFTNFRVDKEFISFKSFFDQTIFDNCRFNHIQIELTTFINCEIIKSTFYLGKIIHTEFVDDCKITKNHFLKLEYINTNLKNDYTEDNSYLSCIE